MKKIDFSKLIWKLKRKFEQLRIEFSGNPRPSSHPFISGDSFRAIAEHLYEKNNFLKPDDVKNNDVVFVESGLLESFFKEIHPKIFVQYVLISHNGDTNIDEKYISYIDDKIIHWFAQNVLVEHSKITPIPIGLENAHYANAGLPGLYKNKAHFPLEKKKNILHSFSVATNPEDRKIALTYLSESPLAISLNKDGSFVSQPSYIKNLKSFMFVASPAGNGLDCHRTWEAQYVGTIPIVKRSVTADFFEKLGLPIWCIESWDELGGLSKEELGRKFEHIMMNQKRQPLYMDYWAGKIRSMKN